MDPYSEHVTKYLTNFTGFASNFTKAFIPIVDTAIKMSSGEPVSAYSVFKAAKDMADANKKSKKRQYSTKKGTNAKSTSKGRIKKLACAPSENSTKTMGKNNKLNVSAQTKTPSATKNNTKHEVNKIKNDSGKKPNEAEVTRKGNDPKLKGFEEVNILDNLYKNDGKKLSKRSKKREKDLGDSAEELKKDNNTLGDEDESFDNGGFDGEGNEEKSHSDIGIYSDEYTVGESDSYSEGETAAHYTDEESSSTNEEDNQAAEALAQAILAKSSKKRKSPKTKNNLTNGISESKKLKKSEETKTASYKRFPADKSGRHVELKRHCSSLASEDDSTKRSVPSISSHADKPEKHVEETNSRRSPLASIGDITKKSTPKVVVNKITAANIKLEPLSPPSNLIKLNSIEEGKRVFSWLLNPLTVDDFFNKYWEQKACLIKRQQDNYFTHLISFEAIDKMLLKNHVEFTKNIDITSYKNDIRETLNPEGRALPPIVWDHYGQGCSIRLLNPQTFLPNLFTLSTTLQEYFHCLVGFNVYITPPNSQGFAPHYDDIEAFILQIEGRKRWKLYKPRKTSEILPRYSSGNFTQQEIGKPVFEEVLEPGDVLYFPRGTIHQACTEPGYHSLHITLSVYQKQSYADLFEKMLPLMLQKFIATNVDVRRGLPLNAWQHAGIAFSNNTTKERADLIKKVAQLMQKFMRDLPLKDIMDMAIDQMAKKFQHEALPPEVLPAEKLRTVFGSRSRANELGECVCDYDIDERTNVRLLRANILRLVEEEEKIRIYYYLDNSKEYCAYEPNFIEIDATEAASMEILIKSYPQYVGVSQLPLPSDEEKITLVTALWERGLLMMEKPFK